MAVSYLMLAEGGEQGWQACSTRDRQCRELLQDQEEQGVRWQKHSPKEASRWGLMPPSVQPSRQAT